MIPILWRTIATGYLKPFILTVASFVLLLLGSRFKIIARFATESSDPWKLGLFTVYQIPFILPMAIPLSALIASFLLFQRLSKTNELTALRASGLGLKKILAPILYISCFLTLLNFSICGSVAPFCKREAKIALYEEISSNPFSLLQKKEFAEAKGVFLKMDVEGSLAKNFTLATFNESNQRLNLVTAEELIAQNALLVGQHVTIVSHLPENGFDSLIIESQDAMSMDLASLDPIIKKTGPKLDSTMLNFRMLLTRVFERTSESAAALAEVFRRGSISLAVFSFTLLGAIFGIENARNPSKRNIIYLLLLTMLVLTSYFLGKSVRSTASVLIYLVPHLTVWLSCYFQARRLSRGLL